jgi:hypothetical protein
MTKDENLKRQYSNDRGGRRVVTSTDSAVTGEGGNRVIVDDPHNVREAESEQQRENVIDWWDGAMSSRLNQINVDSWMVIGQRTHEDDLFGHIMRTDDMDVGNAEDQWLRALTRFSDRSASLIASGKGEAASRAMEELARTFGPVLDLPPEVLVDAVGSATDEATAEPSLAVILVEKKTSPAKPDPTDDPLSLLKAGVAEVRQAMRDRAAALDIERMVVDMVFRVLKLSRAAVLLLDPDRQAYRVRSTLAEREPNRLLGFAVSIQSGADLVHLALARKLDVYIDNPRDAKIAPRLPGWISSHGAHPFFLLPMLGKDDTVMGLFYGQQREDVKLSREELGQLAELRDLLQSRLVVGD